ncbi:MAG: nitroreductase family protein [Verrucomicrobiales bacterium]|nr:nitroreductase family protein [Verrucomicrobiales bacterium]
MTNPFTNPSITAPRRGAKPTPSPEHLVEGSLSAPGGRPLKDLADIVMNRRATSHFTNEAVPAEVLDFILRVGAQAPSGYNLQPWRFIVVRTEGGRKRLRKASMNQEKITEAPLVIIAIGMKSEPLAMAEEILAEGARRGAGSPEEVEKTAVQARKFLSEFPLEVWVNRHTMIAVTYLMLAAEACGYDTAPMEGFDPAGIKRGFGVPEEGEIVALLAIGRMKEPDKAYPGRLPLDRIFFRESYGLPWHEGFSSEAGEEKAKGPSAPHNLNEF